MFRRRVELRPLEKLRAVFWPRGGWGRTLRYGWRRVWRLTGSPHAVAVGVAAGAFSSCSPYLGFHFAIAMLGAWVFRGNLIAAAFGTFLGNPLTYPAIWFVVYETGIFMLGKPAGAVAQPSLSEDFLVHGAFDKILPVLMPMIVGSIPVGIALALVFYVVTRMSVGAYQIKRREGLAERALARRVMLDPAIDATVSDAANDLGDAREKG